MTEPIIAKAKKALSEGDLETAEVLLSQSLEKNLKLINEKKEAAESDAYELGGIKELQLDYQEALSFYKQAVELDPKNTLYLTKLGMLFHVLGNSKKAIEFFNQAFESGLKTYGPEHPRVARVWSNLGSAWEALGEYQMAIEFYNTH